MSVKTIETSLAPQWRKRDCLIMSTAKSVANEKAEQSAKAKPAKAPKQAASSEIYKLTLPNTFNREAIDSIRASLSQKTSAANISITATTVETISASALLMLLSAARTSQRFGFQFSIERPSSPMHSAIEALGLSTEFDDFLKL